MFIWKVIVGAKTYLLIGAAVIAALAAIAFAIDNNGYNRAKSECDVASVQAERDAALQDLSAAKAAQAAERKTVETLEAQKGTDDAALRALEDELAKRPVGERCIITDTDAERLR